MESILSPHTSRTHTEDSKSPTSTPISSEHRLRTDLSDFRSVSIVMVRQFLQNYKEWIRGKGKRFILLHSLVYLQPLSPSSIFFVFHPLPSSDGHVIVFWTLKFSTSFKPDDGSSCVKTKTQLLRYDIQPWISLISRK